MPSTFTPNKLGAELMATGEQDGLWGGITNDNWDLTDLALGGNFAISLASSNVTVSAANATNAAFPLTGVLSANVEVKFPEVGGVYIVKNGTTGSFSVTIKTTNGASTGVVVPQGRSVVVWSDGTNIYDATSVAGLGALAFLNTVGTSQIDNASVTAAKLASDAAQPYGGYAGLSGDGSANYTLLTTDIGKLVLMSRATANAVTFPPNASVAIAVGKWVFGAPTSTGQTTLTPGAGVTLRSSGSRLKTAAQYSGWQGNKIATDEWLIFGDLVA